MVNCRALRTNDNMAKSVQQKVDNIIDWEETSITGPTLTFHAGCVVGIIHILYLNCISTLVFLIINDVDKTSEVCFTGNNFYIHGGIETKDGKAPSNKLYQLNSSGESWKELSSPGSPSLSHHQAVALSDRYIILVGGWNGRARSSKIYAFDTEKQLWMEPTVSGFPEDGGLSSHTATALSSGEILILGREGSLRMQRRHGSGYILSGNVESAKFTYKEYTQETASRSGHTASIIGNTLYIVGGRDNNLIEMHSGFKSPITPLPVTNSITSAVGKLNPVSKMPGGRKNHIAIESPGALLIHGGETFDGRSREPVGEMYIFSRKPTPTFYKVGVSEVKRAGHVCGVVGDKIILHGGFGGKNQVYGNTFYLKFKE